VAIEWLVKPSPILRGVQFFRNLEVGLRYPWWVIGLFALVLGFGTAQDSIRHLGSADGAAVIGYGFLLVGGLVILGILLPVAVLKWQNRHDLP